MLLEDRTAHAEAESRETAYICRHALYTPLIFHFTLIRKITGLFATIFGTALIAIVRV